MRQGDKHELLTSEDTKVKTRRYRTSKTLRAESGPTPTSAEKGNEPMGLGVAMARSALLLVRSTQSSRTVNFVA
jgi:hypothetical protein